MSLYFHLSSFVRIIPFHLCPANTQRCSNVVIWLRYGRDVARPICNVAATLHRKVSLLSILNFAYMIIFMKSTGHEFLKKCFEIIWNFVSCFSCYYAKSPDANDWQHKKQNLKHAPNCDSGWKSLVKKTNRLFWRLHVSNLVHIMSHPSISSHLEKKEKLFSSHHVWRTCYHRKTIMSSYKCR